MIRFRIVIAAITLAMIAPMGSALADSVRVVVNRTEITDTAIALRAALFKLERRGSNNSARLKLAREELIEEALKLEEGERLGIKISQKKVDDAYLGVARNLRMSADKLDQVLAANGVNKGTLKARLKTVLVWQEVTQNVVAARVQISDADLDKKASAQLDDGQSYDYLLKEIIFVIPRGSKASASRRRAEANRYRKSFKGCDSAIDLSMSYTDAAVVDVGRRHATQLPAAIAKELSKLQVGGITKPAVRDNGVSMLAICSKTAARDLTFIKGKLRQEEGQEKFQTETDAYLAKLKAKAAISTR